MSDSEEALIGLYTRVSNLEQNGIPGVRDFFATSALSILARESTQYMPASDLAYRAYTIADAMLNERKKGHNGNTAS